MQTQNPQRQGGIGQFLADLPLYAKISLSVLVVLMVAVALGLWALLNFQREVLTADINKNLQAQTNALVEVVAFNLDVQDEALHILSVNQLLQNGVQTANASYTGSAAEIEAQLENLDAQWLTAANSAPLIQSVLNNDLVIELLEYNTQVVSNVETMLTDRYGALIAATNRTSDYVQSDEAWWQAAWNNGQGAVYVGQPEYDSSSATLSIIFAIPIRAHGSDEVIGVLRSTVSIDTLVETLEEFTIGETGYAEIILPDGNRLHSIQDGGLAPVGAEEYEQITAIEDEEIAQIVLEGVPHLVVVDDLDEELEPLGLPPLGWILIVSQEASEALSLVDNTTRLAIAGSAGVLALTAFVIFSITRAVTRPIQALTSAATKLASGDLTQRVYLSQHDEVGTLSESFNNMAEQLQTTFEDLDARVSARTADLETSAEIAAAANQVRDVNDLLSLAVNLIRDRFNFYYVQVYLVQGDQAVLREGTGYVGRRLLNREHKLPLNGRSLVAEAIRTNQPQIVQDTQNNPYFLPNELLPDTRAELTIPLRTKTAVIGVLDIQHSVPNAFEPGTQRLFQSMADQLAVTFENVSLYETTQRRAVEMETVSEVSAAISTNLDLDELLTEVSNLTKTRFNRYHAHVYLLDDARENLVLAAGAGEPGRIMKERGHHIPLNREQSLVARAARTRQAVIVDDVTESPDFLPNPLLPLTRSEMALPMVVGDQLIGVLDIQDDHTDAFDAGHADVQRTLAGQIAVAVQNARAFEQINAISSVQEAILNSAGSAIIVTTVEGTITLFNPRAEEMLGYTAEEMVNKLTPAVFHDLDEVVRRAQVITEELGRTIEPGFEVFVAKSRLGIIDENEWTYIRKDGTRFPVNLAVTAIRDTAGEITAFMGVATDISTRKQAEAARREADQLLRSVIDHIPMRVFWKDRQSRFLGVNRPLAQDVGVEPERMLGKSDYDFFPQSEADNFVKDDRYIMESGEMRIGYEELLTVPNKPTSWLRTNKLPLRNANGNIIGVLGTYEDITASKQAEEDLRLRNRAIESSTSGVTIADATRPDMPLIYVNPTFERITGYSFAEVVGHNCRFLQNDDRDQADLAELRAALKEGRDCKVLLRNYRKNGEMFWNELIIAPIHDAQGNVTHFVGVSNDVTERVEVEQERSVLAAVATRLVAANTPDELLAAFDVYASLIDVDTSLLLYLDSDAQGQAEFATVVAARNDVAGILNTTFRLADLPFSHLWMANPSTPLLIEDVLNDAQVDETTRAIYTQSQIRSTAVLPLTHKEGWVALMVYNWHKPRQFSLLERRIFTALMERAAVAIASARANEEVSAARSEAEQRAAELQTVARVSTATTTLLNVTELLLAVAELTKESFNLYHAHIYLLDNAGENLVLAAGAGDPGRRMRERGHAIPLKREHSLVARAARTRRAVVSNDVTQEADFLPNPLLPLTRSEMAIPMIIGDTLLGVLDVQSEVVNRFTEQDVIVKSTLADQIAVAVNNARIYEVEREAAERLREVDRLKSQFLANMSHELRTPLNSIIGYSEVLLDGVDGDLPEEAIEDVEAIHDSGKHLLALINEILDMAKIDAGQLNLDRKPIDLPKIMGDALKTGQALVKDKPVKIELVETSPVPQIHADALRLRQIMLNLVSNAVKFTEHGSVTISYGMHNDHEVFIKVQDTGMGISPDNLPLIFERFRQVDGSSTRRAGGTGLGLSITQQLVQLHGGDIYAESTLGTGSTFWFTLPTSETAPIVELATTNGANGKH